MSAILIQNLNPKGGKAVVVKHTSSHPQPSIPPPTVIQPGGEHRFEVTDINSVIVTESTGNNH